EGDRFSLVKHLNMSEILIPSGTGLNEHYCRRWLALRILKQLESKQRKNGKVEQPIVDVQVSRFVESPSRFLCIAMARHLALNPAATSSVALGFRVDDVLERAVSFLSDPAIDRFEINGTCERCPLTVAQCEERVAPASFLELEREHQEIEKELASLAG
ncbi:MAG: hypothetical protein ACREAC_32960, partial [Blastocatellia bacterium]